MLSFSETGPERASGPVVLLLHGISANRHRWAPVAQELSADLRCVSVDLPGHGDSPATGCSVPEAAVAVQELIDAHAWAPDVVVVGHSMGGNVALIHAALFGPASVVAIEPVPLHLPHLAASLAPYAEQLRSGDFDAAFAAWEERRFPTGTLGPAGAALSDDRRLTREVALSYWASVLDEQTAAEQASGFADALAAITVPTLVLLANPPSPEDAAILRRMTSTTVEVWAGQGHFLHLVDPARFATRLREWIAGLHTANGR